MTNEEIQPDTKDWTWVLSQRCPECGFTATDVDGPAIAGTVRDLSPRWVSALHRADARDRPDPTTWSTLEYGAHVRDVMRSGDAVPAVSPDTPLTRALLEISQKGMGMTAIVDEERRPIGVFTDGDLRRLIERVTDFSNISIRDVMHANPRRVHPEQLAVDAVAVMEEFRINQMLVVGDDGVLVGALHIHDLTRAKVI